MVVCQVPQHNLVRQVNHYQGYHLHGTEAEQIKQIGNSVSTRTARALTAAIAAQSRK